VDIPRAPANRGRKRLIYGAIAIVALVATTLGLRSLKPAAPRVDRASVWIDSVQKGPLVIEVRGPGTLVPERIRYISAVTAGRVERRLAEPGQEVEPETVLLELSNPDVQLEALESERQLTVARADRVNLETNLETQRLDQEAAVAAAKAAYQDAKRNAEAAEGLATKELISAIEVSRAIDRVEELETRYKVEEQRLAVMVGATDSQLALQREQVGRLRAVTDFQRGRVQSMKVMAGAHGILQ
jgi:multidrug efflux pump subunit AcrA (membrane-fusion protein)